MDGLDDVALSAAVFLPLAGAVVMLLVPAGVRPSTRRSPC